VAGFLNAWKECSSRNPQVSSWEWRRRHERSQIRIRMATS
jgi:hypothetical protein